MNTRTIWRVGAAMILAAALMPQLAHARAVESKRMERAKDLIADEHVVITISHAGYIKRTPLTEYKTQNRGGVGQKGVATRDQDFLEHLYVATNHQYMMFFTRKENVSGCVFTKCLREARPAKAVQSKT